MRWTLLCAAGLALAAGLAPAPAGARGPDEPVGPGENVYCIREPYIFRQNVGLLDLMVTNLGVIGKAGFGDMRGASWHGGEYLYAAAMWIGAIASDNLTYVSTGAYQYELRPSLDLVDRIYPSYEGAPGGNRPGFSPRPDDDGDGLIDEDPLNGKDDDHDGRIDEDYSAISQQMFSCEYWDYTEEARAQYAEHRPLNVKVHQNSYAWSTEGSNEFVGFDFKVSNEGYELLRQVYLGFFVDSDAGPPENPAYYTDDRGAYFPIDTTFTDHTIDFTCTQRIGGEQKDCAEQKMRLDICAMWDVPDDGVSSKGGDVDGYFGGMFLGHTTDPFGVNAPAKVTVHTARFFSGSNAYPAGDPSNDAERYDLLQSGVKLQRPTGVPDDYRYCFSAGPFKELAPGEFLTMQVAFVIGKGKSGMVDNAIRAQGIYNGSWQDVDGNPDTGKEGKETCLHALDPSEPARWKDHCDSLNPVSYTIKETQCIPSNYVDDDCDCCTPLFMTDAAAAKGGLETLVHWVGTVAPPPPQTNLRPQAPNVTVSAPAGDRRVTIQWDNLSELTASPTKPPKILFTGYKVWRVEGWKRPVGSSGPAPDEWQLIANLSLRPEDVPADSAWKSKWYLPKFRHEMEPDPDSVTTGAECDSDKVKVHYPVGRYQFVDSLGLKNGMTYFYDVTAYLYTDAKTPCDTDSTVYPDHSELGSRPSATERDAVVPTWAARSALDEVYVVPNPYVRGQNPDGWDLVPSNADPTGTKLAFVGLPTAVCRIKIYTMAGDLVQTLEHDGSRNGGAVYWNLISRNGQDVVSGVYIYSVECGGKSKLGRFVIVR